MILDLNPITKQTVQGTVKTVANEIKRCMERWEDLAGWLDGLTAEDLTILGIGETDQAYLGSFRLAVKNLTLMYQNQDKIGTDNPQHFVELLADPLVF
ncbi:hypothetical protein [Desulfobulbus elongatus]|uniref:hypothetical protein n=1 Tax=Desulfobulbus elongatus TaxID=53332 RepID=UPI000482968B|nr:hypothetical protein [Desulfobulbus elongatus]